MRRRGVMVERSPISPASSRSNPMHGRWPWPSSCSPWPGMPPLAGFFGKLYVFRPAISAGLYTAGGDRRGRQRRGAPIYYLRIIKVMYFDEPKEASTRRRAGKCRRIMAVAALVILLFFVLPGPALLGRRGGGRSPSAD